MVFRRRKGDGKEGKHDLRSSEPYDHKRNHRFRFSQSRNIYFMVALLLVTVYIGSSKFIDVLSQGYFSAKSLLSDSEIEALILYERKIVDDTYSVEKYFNVTNIGDKKMKTKRDVSPTNPVLVLHVGVNKTGTTSIQNTLTELEIPLSKDNYIFLGKYNRQPHTKSNFDVIHNPDTRNYAQITMKFIQHLLCEDDSKTQRKEFIQMLKKLREEKKNVIISFEDLSALAPPWCIGGTSSERYEEYGVAYGVHVLNELYEDIVVEAEFQVKVVVGYRRFYSWLVSLFYYTGGNVNEMAVTKSETLPTFIEERLLEPHPSLLYMDLYRKFFDNVSFLHLHSSQSITERFLCEFVPNAINSCQAVQNMETSSMANTLKIDSTMVNIIAKAAYDKERRKKNLTGDDLKLSDGFRNLVRTNYKKIKMFYNTDIPKKCISQDVKERLIARSVLFESMCFSNFSKDVELVALFRQIMSEINDGFKYCSVDGEKVVHDFEDLLNANTLKSKLS